MPGKKIFFNWFKWVKPWTSLVAQMVKVSVYNAGDPGSIPGSGRSPGEGNGNLLQYSCLENPMDRGAWWATVHGVTGVWHDWATSVKTWIYKYMVWAFQHTLKSDSVVNSRWLQILWPSSRTSHQTLGKWALIPLHLNMAWPWWLLGNQENMAGVMLCGSHFKGPCSFRLVHWPPLRPARWGLPVGAPLDSPSWGRPSGHSAETPDRCVTLSWTWFTSWTPSDLVNVTWNRSIIQASLPQIPDSPNHDI